MQNRHRQPASAGEDAVAVVVVVFVSAHHTVDTANPVRLDSWKGPRCGIDGRDNLGGSGGRVYQAQESVIPSDDTGGIPAAGFGKALGERNEDFGDRSRLSISGGYNRISHSHILSAYHSVGLGSFQQFDCLCFSSHRLTI
jgi:hypothetical protein